MPERGGGRPLPVCIRAQKLGPSHLLGKSRRPCSHAAGPISPRLRPRFRSPYRRKHIQCRAPPAPHHQGGNRSVGASHAEGSDMLRRRVCAIVGFTRKVELRKPMLTHQKAPIHDARPPRFVHGADDPHRIHAGWQLVSAPPLCAIVPPTRSGTRHISFHTPLCFARLPNSIPQLLLQGYF